MRLISDMQALHREGKSANPWQPYSERQAADGSVENDPRVAALSMEPGMYKQAPHCTEYVIAMTNVMSRVTGRRGAFVPDANSNKMIVSMDGGQLPLHLDNIGGESPDNRLLTVIYFLNPDYAPIDKGRFVTFFPGPNGEVEPQAIEPRGDRLVAFYSDEIYYTVEVCRCYHHDD